MSSRGFGSLIFGGGVALFAVIVLFGCFYTIDQGERGVVLRNGALVGIAEPGFHLKMPIFDDVEYLPIQTVTVAETFEAYSFDQQPADMQLSVTLRAVPSAVGDIYGTYGSVEGLVERIVLPRVREEAKNVFGGFTAAKAIQDRVTLNSQTEESIRAVVPADVLVIESVQIEDIAFDDSYEQAIRDRMQAEVEVQRTEQNAKRDIVTANKDAEQKVIGAKAEAERMVLAADAEAAATRARASADADATKLRGDAEASAIEARGAALRQNPQVIELVRAERWGGEYPSTLVADGAQLLLGLPANGLPANQPK